MKSYIEVNSLPVLEVINDIAKAFDTKLEIFGNEFKIMLPSAYGTGTITAFDVSQGLGYIQYSCKFNQDFEIRFVKNEVQPLKFIYCAEGTICHRFSNSNAVHFIVKYQSGIAASQSSDGHILIFNSDEYQHVHSLEVDRIAFLKNRKTSVDHFSNSTLKEIIFDTKGTKEYLHIGPYSLVIAALFKDMMTIRYEPFTSNLIHPGLCLQVFAQQLGISDLPTKSRNGNQFRKREITLIENTSTYINENLKSLTTVEALAKRIGLGINKLQSGFLYVYKSTVNNYIQDLRLQKAILLLKESDLSISEIVLEVGLQSKSYFSLIFRRRYGITPSEFRKNSKSKAINSK